jgi:hypothetical protein
MVPSLRRFVLRPFLVALVATAVTVAGAGSANAAGELVLTQETAPPKITDGTNEAVDATYRLTAGTAAAVDVQRIAVTFAYAELGFDSVSVGIGGAGSVGPDGWLECDTSDAGPGEVEVACDVTGSVQPATSGATFTVSIRQNAYPAFVGASSIRVAVAGQLTGAGAAVDSNEVTTAVAVHRPPTCADGGDRAGATMAQLTASGFLELDLHCVDPDGGDLASVALSARDHDDHAGTLSQLVDPAGPALPRIRWTPNPGAARSALVDTLLLEVTDADGGSAQVLVKFEVAASIDLDVAMTGPASVVARAPGADVTYSGTVAGNGPDSSSDAWLILDADQDVMVLSGTLDGAEELGCTPYPAFPRTLMCPIGPVIAGESRAFSITLRVEVDEYDNDLPYPLKLTASSVADDDPSVDPDGPQYVTVHTSFTWPQAVVTPIGPRRLVGSRHADRLNGGDGDDQLDGRAGNDRLFGGAGRDRLLGGIGNDVLSGGMGDDKLDAGAGNDKLDGGLGNDILICGPGRDVAAGGGGADKLSCRDGRKGDVINGGAGKDTCIGDRGDRFVGCERIVRS